MKESAQAAGAWSSPSIAARLDPKSCSTSDVHVHVPAGAIPKDGPSAGVACSPPWPRADRAVRSDVSMTGEISLRGLVLPVGGIREGAGRHAGRHQDDDVPPQPPELGRRSRGDAASARFVWLETVDGLAAWRRRVTTDGA
jgi:ATP-dependent Lon protease